jgi:hypothetical protein
MIALQIFALCVLVAIWRIVRILRGARVYV